MPSNPSYTISADASANVLVVRLRGIVDPTSMRECVDEISKLLQPFRAGFTVMTDLTDLKTMDIGCTPEVERMMDICRKKDAGTVIRIIPDSSKDIGFSILSLFHYPSHVHVVTCQTMEEARRALS